MNTKLHAVTDANGRPISLFVTAGQVSDYTGAAALFPILDQAAAVYNNAATFADISVDAYKRQLC